jgi:hypothetical protein
MVDSSRTFFLLGCVRSGTTLLRLMLGHHSRIGQVEEADYLVDMPLLGGMDPELAAYHRHLEIHRGFRATGYRLDPGLPYRELLQSFLDQRRAADGVPFAGFTIHENLDRVGEYWPDARFLYLRRDPRDVARSIRAMGWAGTTWHAAERWMHAEEQWERLCARIPPERRLEVCFEELVADAEAALRGILDFLALDYEARMQEIDGRTTYARPSRKEATSWQGSAPGRDVQLVEARVGERLVRAGYAPSGLPPLRICSARRLALRCENRLRGVAFSIRRLGFRLWLEGVVSRRLPFWGWHRAVELRVHEVVKKHLK